MLICNTPEEVATAKAKFYKWQQCNFPAGDEKIIPLLKMFNMVPGIATIFSCEGHIRTYYDELGGEDRLEVEVPYIMFMVSEEGVKFMVEYWRALFQILTNLYPEQLKQMQYDLDSLGVNALIKVKKHYLPLFHHFTLKNGFCGLNDKDCSPRLILDITEEIFQVLEYKYLDILTAAMKITIPCMAMNQCR